MLSWILLILIFEKSSKQSFKFENRIANQNEILNI